MSVGPQDKSSSPIQAGRAVRSPWRKWSALPVSIIGLVIFMGISSGVGFVANISDQASLSEYQAETVEVQLFRTALIDAETGVRGYVLTGQHEYLEPYASGIHTLSGADSGLLQALERFSVSRPDASPDAAPFIRTLADLRAAWSAAIKLVEANQRPEAEESLRSNYSKNLMDRLRRNIDGFLGQRAADAHQIEQRLFVARALLLIISAAGTLIAVTAMVYAFRGSAREARGREIAIAEGVAARKQVEQLHLMADMLQSAGEQEDTDAVLRTAALGLLPGLSGALYVFNNSHDRLALSTSWGSVKAEALVEHIAPNACWALKRGKPYLNAVEESALRCRHAPAGLTTLEIPMAARGQVYGLLQIIAEGDDAHTCLDRIQPVASAISDGMSLALSSIALRERLRNQALRDALTGLYNRHFLEETLERMCLDAERRKSSIAAIMIDIDHFKRLNDQHGHAAGDAVLQEVSATILLCLRRTDMACRYGGEELAILLPDCTLVAAEEKAEQIRTRIADLVTGEGLSVTASLGVATIPDTASKASELLGSADAALYQAKQNGRNRVIVASTRAATHKLSLIESGS
jgi:diguanylate cyclase (GGDEF)-like protein